MLIFAGGGKLENPENPRSTGENQQQTQLAYDTESGLNQGHSGERWALTATPPMLPKLNNLINHQEM
jgi:hypothetical protein